MKRFFSLKTLFIGLIVLMISLTGCGGGGGGGSKPNYLAAGVGVIMVSREYMNQSTAGKSFHTNYFQSSWKQMDISLNGISGFGTQSEPGFRAAAVSDQFLRTHVSFIYLKWSRVDGANRYRIFYEGVKVWDWWDDTIRHGDDPAFELDNPEAYLDLTYELDGRITSASDDYKFQIVAYNGNNEIARLPEVNTSIGMVLESLPVITDFNATSPNLTWSEVNNASKYRVTLTDRTSPVVRTFKDEVTGSTTNTYDVERLLTAQNPQKHYDVWVDARYLDDNGVLKEVTRGVGGLDL